MLLLLSTQASALDCPKMPEQSNKDWDVEVKAVVGKIGPVQGAELQTKTKSAVTDLMGKLPQADKLYLQQMMYATYCSGLRDDKTLSESEKAKLIREYNKEVQNALAGKPAPLPHREKTDTRSEAPQQQTPENARLALSRLSLPFTGQAFVERVKENDVYAVKLYLAAGMNPNQVGWIPGFEVTALNFAIRNKNREVIKALLDHGADVNVPKPSYPLSAAAVRSMMDIVEQITAKGANERSIRNAVASAAATGSVEALRFLLNKGGNTPHALSEALLDASESQNESDLYINEQGLPEAVRILLDYKADVDSRNNCDMTPLMLASHRGRAVIVRMLLDAGASVNAKTACSGWEGSTALLMAIAERHEDVAKILLNRGALSAVADKKGNTALTLAAGAGTGGFINLLIDKGVDINKRNNEGQTALIIAADKGNQDAVGVLTERGSTVLEKDDRGKTAYQYAMQLGDGHPAKDPILQYLRAAGAK